MCSWWFWITVPSVWRSLFLNPWQLLRLWCDQGCHLAPSCLLRILAVRRELFSSLFHWITVGVGIQGSVSSCPGVWWQGEESFASKITKRAHPCRTSSPPGQLSLRWQKMLLGKTVTIVMDSPGVSEGWITKLSNRCVGVYFWKLLWGGDCCSPRKFVCKVVGFSVLKFKNNHSLSWEWGDLIKNKEACMSLCWGSWRWFLQQPSELQQELCPLTGSSQLRPLGILCAATPASQLECSCF